LLKKKTKTISKNAMYTYLYTHGTRREKRVLQEHFWLV